MDGEFYAEGVLKCIFFFGRNFGIFEESKTEVGGGKWQYERSLDWHFHCQSISEEAADTICRGYKKNIGRNVIYEKYGRILFAGTY